MRDEDREIKIRQLVRQTDTVRVRSRSMPWYHTCLTECHHYLSSIINAYRRCAAQHGAGDSSSSNYHVILSPLSREQAQLDLKLAGDAVTALRDEIDAFRLTYETVLTEDKAVDKAFKKEIADSPMADELTKLFKKRAYPQPSARREGEGPALLDPFAAMAAAHEAAFPRPEPLDW